MHRRSIYLIYFVFYSYPAGFVYLFGALYYMTDRGTNILRAQYIFAGFYWIMLALVAYIYTRTKKVYSTSNHPCRNNAIDSILTVTFAIHEQCPPIVLLVMSLTSYRIHSVFVLRLFNDPLAMMILYASIVCFIRDRWAFGCVLYRYRKISRLRCAC